MSSDKSERLKQRHDGDSVKAVKSLSLKATYVEEKFITNRPKRLFYQ